MSIKASTTGSGASHANVPRAIATTAGPLQQGQSTRWQVDEKLPLTERSGTLQVARSFGGPIASKDVVFKIDDGEHHVFVATICLNDQRAWYGDGGAQHPSLGWLAAIVISAASTGWRRSSAPSDPHCKLARVGAC